MLIKRYFFMTLVKYRLSFYFTNLSQHFGIYLVVFELKLYIQRHDRGKSELKSFMS